MALTRASAAVVKTEELVNNRNRIINGDMRIDQRNAGANVSTSTPNDYYITDRWIIQNRASAGVVDAEQDTEAPTGFTNSLKLTVTTIDNSLTGVETFITEQRIEGLNIDDLAWGTASAKTVTLSFWVRSSVTGQHGGALLASTQTSASYPFAYTINSADTWEYKTITVPGPTIGTWLTTNGVGMRVRFSLGTNSTYQNPAGSWVAARSDSSTGSVNVLETLNATWYITGVQLEVGSVATPFERRPYGTELALCQRYYEKTLSQGTTSASGQTSGALIGIASSTTNIAAQWTFKQTKRATPTLTLSSFNGTAGSWANISNIDFAVTQPWGVGDNGFARLDSTGMTGGAFYWGFAVASAEL
jgi:hypothetical protein